MKCEHTWSYCNDKVYWCRLCGCLIAHKIIYIPAHHKIKMQSTAKGHLVYRGGSPIKEDEIRDAKKVK